MRNRSSDRGFTLVELLVAVVLLTTGLTAAAAAIAAVTRAQAAAGRRMTAARLAEAKLAELQASGTISGAGDGTFAELNPGQNPASGAGGSVSAGSLAAAGAATSDWSDYSYHWEFTTSSDLPGLARVEVLVWYRDDDRNPFRLIWYLPSQ
jgi:prepilin-type N-terminal cleavage/methylation domain-containing protein